MQVDVARFEMSMIILHSHVVMTRVHSAFLRTFSSGLHADHVAQESEPPSLGAIC